MPKCRVGLVLFGAVALSSALAAQHWDAERHRLLPAAGQGLAVGDFDNDGDPDLVWSGAPAGIAWNDGEGRFAVSGPTTVYLGAIVGDIDGDGDLDVARSGNYGPWFPMPTQLWRNDGAGVFTDVSMQWQSAPEALSGRFLDWDTDGDLDLVTVGDYQDWLNEYGVVQGVGRIFVNSGTGSFVDSGNWLAPPDAYTGMDFADIDGDGDLDCVICSRQTLPYHGHHWFGPPGQIRVLVHDAQHRAVVTAGRVSGIVGPISSYLDVALSDHDLDGDPDLAVAASDGVHLLRNDGAGFFARYAFVPGAASSVQAHDFDGDQRQDLLIEHYPGVISIVHFSPPWVHRPPARLLRNTAAGFVDVSATHLEAAAANPGGGLVFDVDGDVDLDIVKSASPQTMVWLNDGQGRLLLAAGDLLSNCRVQVAQLADIDGDGFLDAGIVEGTISDAWEVSVVWNRGGGPSATRQVVVPFWRPGTRPCLTFVDHDRDGDLDLFVGGAPANLLLGLQRNILLLNHGGSWKDVTDAVLPTAETAQFVAVGDVTGDGLSDLVTTAWTAASLLVATGTGAFANASTLLPIGVTGQPHLVDFDGDGDLDILGSAGGVYWSPGVRLLRNDWPNPFVDVTNLLPPMSGPPAPIDVDGDGRQDVMCLDGSNLRVFRWSSGAFVDETAMRVQGSVGGGVIESRLYATDVDGDGWQDVVRAGPRMRNDHGILSPWPPVPYTGPEPVFGDVDGDGDVDQLGESGVLLDRTRQLFVARPWRLGMQSELVLQAHGGNGVEPQAALLMLANDEGVLPIPGIGTLFLDPATLSLHSLHTFPGTGGEVSIVCTTPAQPSLLGTVLHAQALYLHRPSTGELRFSNRAELRIRL